MKRARIAVLVSGGGTNLESLLKAQEAGQIPHGEIVAVLSSVAGAVLPSRGREKPRRNLKRALTKSWRSTGWI